jgi:hypothetical protein
MGNEIEEFQRWKDIPQILIKRGGELLNQPYQKVEFTHNSLADDLLNDLTN